MSDKKNSFSDFGHDFESRVVQSLVLDPRWSEQMNEIIKVEYFTLDYLAFIVSKYYKYYYKYKTFPSISILITILKDALTSVNDEEKTKKIVSFLKKVKNEPDLNDLPYVKEKALDFCRKAAMREALDKSIDLAASDTSDNHGLIIEIMKKAIMAGEENSIGHDFEEDTELRFREETREPLPIGIYEVDKVLRGGLDKSRLGVYVAAPGVGKTSFLVQIGATNLLNGEDVIHYTLEMNEEEVGRKYDAFITGINSEEIIERQDEVREFYKKLKEEGRKLGRLIIKEYNSGVPTANTFKAHIQKVEVTKKFIPKLIIVDYADEMNSIQSFDSTEGRHKYKAIYRDLRNLAREFRVSLWTASQSNKEGSSADILTGENMSESYRKLDVPDVVLSGACKPQNKIKGILKFFLIKNRSGTDSVTFPIYVDRTTSRFQVITQEEYDELSQTDEEYQNEQKKKLNKKYKEMIKKIDKDFGAKPIEKIENTEIQQVLN